jgi:hypothetical protein
MSAMMSVKFIHVTIDVIPLNRGVFESFRGDSSPPPPPLFSFSFVDVLDFRDVVGRGCCGRLIP